MHIWNRPRRFTLSNAGVLQAFGANDDDTADMLSKTMGREIFT